MFVYLEGAPATDGSAQSPALLDQVRLPLRAARRLASRSGSRCVSDSSDPTMHNVHFVQRMNRARNLAMTSVGAQDDERRFDHAEFIRVKCDVHPWMTA